MVAPFRRWSRNPVGVTVPSARPMWRVARQDEVRTRDARDCSARDTVGEAALASSPVSVAGRSAPLAAMRRRRTGWSRPTRASPSIGEVRAFQRDCRGGRLRPRCIVDAFAQQRVLYALGRPARLGLALRRWTTSRVQLRRARRGKARAPSASTSFSAARFWTACRGAGCPRVDSSCAQVETGLGAHSPASARCESRISYSRSTSRRALIGDAGLRDSATRRAEQPRLRWSAP